MHFPLQVGLGGYVVEGLSMAGRQPRVLVADDSNAVHQLIALLWLSTTPPMSLMRITELNV
jgi:hypothetical protein